MGRQYLADAAATEAFGARMAACCRTGGLIFFHGELGAGKTTLVRGLLRALDHTGPVKSPTYALVESYQLASGELHHLDLYRLADPGELEWIGIRDLLGGDALVLIEWPGHGKGVLPEPDLELTMHYREAGREIEFRAVSGIGHKWLSCLES